MWIEVFFRGVMWVLSSILLFPPPDSSSLFPAVRFRPSSLCWQTHRHGDDEIHPGDFALSVLCLPPWGFDLRLPPTDQQPLPAACRASPGGWPSQHDVLTQTEGNLGKSLTLLVVPWLCDCLYSYYKCINILMHIHLHIDIYIFHTYKCKTTSASCIFYNCTI